MRNEDNLDDLLRELEVKEKSQQKNSQKESNSRVDETRQRTIIAEQNAEIERLKAQLVAQKNNSVSLDFTSDFPTPDGNNKTYEKAQAPPTPSPNYTKPNKKNNNNRYSHNKPNYIPKHGNSTPNSGHHNSNTKNDVFSPKANSTYNPNSNSNVNLNSHVNRTPTSHSNNNYSTNNNNSTNNHSTNNNATNNNATNNNATNNNATNNRQNTTVSDEDLELEKLKAELEMEEKRLHKKLEADRLRNEINKLRAHNNSNENNNNNNTNKNNYNNNSTTHTKSTPQEAALVAEIERMKQELGDASYSEKSKIDELEKIRESLKQELNVVKKAAPAKPDPVKERQIAELDKKRLDLQRELLTGPSKAELMDLHGQNKKELLDIQFGVDVCFLMDCTGSMMAFIRAAKQNIRKVVEEIKVIDPRAVLRFAFVGYRDYGDLVQHERLDFLDVSQLEAFEKKLDSIRAEGGGDPPEDIAGGLDLCTNLSWKASTRLLIHIGDAPCHGRRYHAYDDNYPNGDPKGLEPEQLLKKLLNLRVDYYFLRMTRYTDSMIAIFKKVYDAAKKTFEVHPVASDPANFLPKVVASIHSSMGQSVSFRK